MRCTTAVVIVLGACADEVPSGVGPVASTAASGFVCGDTRLAPPTFIDRGHHAVPVDAEAVHASFDLDMAERTVTARGELTFRLGFEAGYPVLDLRPEIRAAWLDGERLDLGREVARRWPPHTPPELTAPVVVVRRVLEPCSRHTVAFEYALPTEPTRVNDHLHEIAWPRWGEDIIWHADLSDYVPGYLLERWAPAPVWLADRFTVVIDFALVGAGERYEMLANGAVTRFGRTVWRLSWDAADVMTPFFCIFRKDKVLSLPGEAASLDMRTGTQYLRWELPLDDARPDAEATLAELAQRFGPRRKWDHPFLLIAARSGSASGMEYPNAATVSAFDHHLMRHEIAHAWFGRTLLPARHQDAWFDEAMATFIEDDQYRPGEGRALPVDPWSDTADPFVPPEPWARRTVYAAYMTGVRVFETLYETFGRAAVDDVWRALFARCGGEYLTHHDLRRAFGTLGDPDLVDALFYGWVIPVDDPDIQGTCAMAGVVWPSRAYDE